MYTQQKSGHWLKFRFFNEIFHIRQSIVYQNKEKLILYQHDMGLSCEHSRLAGHIQLTITRSVNENCKNGASSHSNVDEPVHPAQIYSTVKTTNQSWESFNWWFLMNILAHCTFQHKRMFIWRKKIHLGCNIISLEFSTEIKWMNKTFIVKTQCWHSKSVSCESTLALD
jgi:hypothetical protein